MGQIPAQLAKAGQQTGDVLGPIARQTGRFLTQPIDVQSQSAENRVIPQQDWPIQDYGYKALTPEVPAEWWKQAPGAKRK